MQNTVLEKQISELQEKKAKIARREKLLRLKERKLKTKKSIELGALVVKARLDQFDQTLLLGALLEIGERASEEAVRESWIKRAETFLRAQKQADDVRLIVSFSSPPSEEIKAVLKRLRFQRNEYRKEWYGRGRRDAIEKALEGSVPTIEEALD